MQHNFSLTPSTIDHADLLRLQARLWRDDHQPHILHITFGLDDPAHHVQQYLQTNNIHRTAPSPPQRQDYLWEQTCFEVFMQVQGTTAYHEINVSTTGEWNVYQFDSYRTPNDMPPRHAELPLLQGLTYTATGVVLEIDLDVYPAQTVLQLGLCSVLLLQADQPSFWALQHTALQADFHHAPDWVIQVVV